MNLAIRKKKKDLPHSRLYLALVEQNTQSLFKLAVWYCRNEKHAAYALEAAYSELRENIQAVNESACPKCELINILKAQCDLLRVRNAELNNVMPENYATSSEMVLLRKVLQVLPVHYSEPFELQIVTGLSVDEIAKVLRISEAEASARLSEARNKVTSLLLMERSFKSQTLANSKLSENYADASFALN